MNLDQLYTKRRALKLRSEILVALRAFFNTYGYMEVETPIRIPRPLPEAHIEAVSSDGWYLQTSPELCMKPLLAAGYQRIFQICKCFRHKERGAKHLPELTMLEWYAIDQDYYAMMDQCEALICFVANQVGCRDKLVYQGQAIDMKRPWQRLSVSEAFEQLGSSSLAQALAADRFDELIALEIEPGLDRSRPVFLYDYPAASGSLARLKPADQGLAERFELYIGGLELCNAFTELTDPAEQRRRFELELKRRRRDGLPEYTMPEHFLEVLHRLPDASGNALGVDRLVMLLADADTIDAVVTFVPEDL
jgi:lysyl-tRNA synthetase class 2